MHDGHDQPLVIEPRQFHFSNFQRPWQYPVDQFEFSSRQRCSMLTQSAKYLKSLLFEHHDHLSG